MPYYKKKTYRRRRYNRKTKVKTVGDYTLRETANAAWQGVKSIKRLINVEYKRNDLILSGTVANSAFLNDLSVLPVGDQSTNRDGISVKPLNLTIRGYFEQTSGNTLVRMIIFRGKQENTVTPLVSDVMSVTSSTGAIFSPKQYDKRFKSKIIYDRVFNLNSASTAQQVFEKTIRLDGHINYDEADTTGVAKENAGLYLILVSDKASASEPSYYFRSRMSFVDN